MRHTALMPAIGSYRLSKGGRRQTGEGTLDRSRNKISAEILPFKTLKTRKTRVHLGDLHTGPNFTVSERSKWYDGVEFFIYLGMMYNIIYGADYHEK